MKKILNTILLLVIVTVLVLPAGSAKAAETKRRLGATYRAELVDFLVNYRGSTLDHRGCVRTSSKPDGLTSDCLSNKKVTEILAQLDKDGYFLTPSPDKRRLYLSTTTHQIYVMRKVVMYFEQVLNPSTVVYQSSLTAEQNYQASGSVISNANLLAVINKDLASAGSTLLGQPDPDDTLLVALAIKTSGASQLIIIPKTEILQSNLDRIYKTRRMAPFASNHCFSGATSCPSEPQDWTGAEMTELGKVLDIADKAVASIKNKKMSPSRALMIQKASALAMTAVGGLVGGEIQGGLSLADNAEFGTTGKFSIGGSTALLDASALNRMFEKSDIPTSVMNVLQIDTRQQVLFNPALYHVGEVSTAMDIVYQANKRFFPTGPGLASLDKVFADALPRKVFFLNRENMLAKWASEEGEVLPDGFINWSGDVFFRSSDPIIHSDAGPAIFEGSNMSRTVEAHELVHQVQFYASSRLNIPRSNYYSLGFEDLTDWIAVTSIRRYGLDAKYQSIYFPELMDGIVAKLMQKEGIPRRVAEDQLFWINGNLAPYQLDQYLGSGFWDKYVSLRNTLQPLKEQYAETAVFNPAINTQKNAISDFIRGR